MVLQLATSHGNLERNYCIEKIVDRFRGSELFKENEGRLRHNLKAMSYDDLFHMYHQGHGISRASGCSLKSRVSEKVRRTLQN